MCNNEILHFISTVSYNDDWYYISWLFILVFFWDGSSFQMLWSTFNFNISFCIKWHACLSYQTLNWCRCSLQKYKNPFQLASLTIIIAAASAHQIYNTAPQHESYANAAEIYQSQLEYQQHGLYSDQSQAYTGHTSQEATYENKPSVEKGAKILNFESENNGHAYQYSYETENGKNIF